MEQNGKRILLLLLLGICSAFFSLVPLFSQERTFTVVIDPGHGGKDPGALGSKTKEKNIVLPVGIQLGNLIKQYHPDVRVIYTRNDDRFVALNRRAEIANKAHADLFISLHCNALSKNKVSPRGVETYVLGLHRSKDNLDVAKAENAVIMYEEDYSAKYEGFNPNEPESYIIFEFLANEYLDQSVSLATSVQNQLVRNSKMVNRNVRQAGFLVLREVAMPSILIELGYISNKQDEAYLNSVKGQHSIARSIYNGFKAYKREYDKKNRTFASVDAAPSQERTGKAPADPLQDGGTISDDAQQSNPIEYRIQFLTSARKYQEGAAALKGLSPVDYYLDGKIYKYTYGRTTDKREIDAMLKHVRKKFNDAFIVEFSNGKRVK